MVAGMQIKSGLPEAARPMNSIQNPQNSALIVVQSAMQRILSMHYLLARLVKFSSYYIIVSSSFSLLFNPAEMSNPWERPI